MKNKFLNLLRQFVSISDQEFEETIVFFKEIKLKKGDFFVKQGVVCKHFGYIGKGTLRTFYINEKHEDTTSCFCTEDHLTTSYKSFILQQPSELSIQALEDAEMLIADYESLNKLYTLSNTWQIIGRAVAEREYIAMEKYASVLNNETAKEKYVRLLKEQPQIIQRSPVQYIASYLGITTRTLSRIRKEITEGI